MNLTLAVLRRRVGNDEESAYLLLEGLRWPDGPICSHCGHDRAYFLKPKNDAGRRTGPAGTRSVRRVWKCASCRKQFSVLTGTIFHGTKVPIADWLTVMVLMSSAKNGISAREVERELQVTPETAWFMLHRLREAMRRESVLAPFSGEAVNHSRNEYVRYEGDRVITSNQAENYFSQLKRSLDGTFHHVSREHLQRYLDEFDFRYSTRKMKDGERLQRMVDQADGRRLTYERIIDE